MAFKGKIRRLFGNGGGMWDAALDLGLPGPYFFFVLSGSLGMLIFVILAIELHKHVHHYVEEIFVASLVLVPAFGAYLFMALRQGVHSIIRVVRNLTMWDVMWGVIFVSGLVLRKRTAAEILAAPVDTAAAFRIILVTLTGLFLLFRLFMKKTDWLKSLFQGAVGAMTIFALVCLTSTMWSVYWSWTFYKSCEYSVDIALLAAILISIRSTDQFNTLFSWTWMLYGGLLITTWIGVVLDPSGALEAMASRGVSSVGVIGIQLSGVFPDISSNFIGEYGAILAIVALTRLLPLEGRRNNRAWYIFIFFASMLTLFLSQCRSAILGLAVAVFLLYLLSNRVVKGAIIVISGSLLAIVFGGLTWLEQYMARGQSAQELDTLSNRIYWWTLALKEYARAPLTGYGAYAAGRFGVLAKAGYNATATVHSDWIEIVVGTGFWGVIPILASILITWWLLLKFLRDRSLTGLERNLVLEALGAFTVITIRTIFMTDITWHPPLHYFVILGYAEYLRRRLKGTLNTVPAPPGMGNSA